MVLVWPAQRAWIDRIRRDGTLILGCVAVLILRTALDPGWWLPWVAGMAILCLVGSRSWWNPKLGAAAVGIVWTGSICLLWRPGCCEFGIADAQHVNAEAVLVCAGDSLTSGLTSGTDAETYVARLRERLGCKVLNAGVADDRTSDLLARLDRDVISRRPTVVLVFIGGNDYLNGTPRRQLAAHLERVVSRVAQAGSKLVIVEVPSGIVWNSYAGIYRRTARRHGAILVRDSRLRWWYTKELLLGGHLDDRLTIDGIHLTPVGATKVAEWLAPYLMCALATTERPGQDSQPALDHKRPQ